MFQNSYDHTNVQQCLRKKQNFIYSNFMFMHKLMHARLAFSQKHIFMCVHGHNFLKVTSAFFNNTGSFQSIIVQH